MDLINQIILGNNFVRSIEPKNRLTQIHTSNCVTNTKKIQQLQAFLNAKKIERFLAKKGVLSSGVLGLNTLGRSCSSHTTFVGLLYPRGDKSEKVYTSYKVQPTKALNLLQESKCRTSVQIGLCNFSLQINNIQKYYLVSFCVISIIIVFAPTSSLYVKIK